jgi:hypothetical protein
MEPAAAFIDPWAAACDVGARLHLPPIVTKLAAGAGALSSLPAGFMPQSLPLAVPGFRAAAPSHSSGSSSQGSVAVVPQADSGCCISSLGGAGSQDGGSLASADTPTGTSLLPSLRHRSSHGYSMAHAPPPPPQQQPHQQRLQQAPAAHSPVAVRSREEALARYRFKKATRCSSKVVRYEARQINALKRWVPPHAQPQAGAAARARGRGVPLPTPVPHGIDACALASRAEVLHQRALLPGTPQPPHQGPLREAQRAGAVPGRGRADAGAQQLPADTPLLLPLRLAYSAPRRRLRLGPASI